MLLVELVDVVFGEREEDVLIPTVIFLEMQCIVDKSGHRKDNQREISADGCYGVVGAGDGSRRPGNKPTQLPRLLLMMEEATVMAIIAENRDLSGSAIVAIWGVGG